MMSDIISRLAFACLIFMNLCFYSIFTRAQSFLKAKTGQKIYDTFLQRLSGMPVQEGGFMRKKHQNKSRLSVTRNYKDTVFRKLFEDKRELLSLYNAVNGTAYDNPEELEIVTLDSAIYMSMKNDLAFIVDFELNLYEHQSTGNPNMPLRFLQYVTKQYERLIDKNLLYRNHLVKIPAPHFIVFYNGTAPQPETQLLKLSSAFFHQEDNPQLELKVLVLNINHGNNLRLMEQCRILKEYTEYVELVRCYAARMDIDAAVNLAVDECITNGILEDFLRKNKAEVVAMSIFEYDEEAVLALIRSDEREDGRNEGLLQARQEAIVELLEDLGEIPESLGIQICEETDLDTLKRWHKLAAKADSIEQFITTM